MSGWLHSLGNAVGVDAEGVLQQLKEQAEKLKEVGGWAVCMSVLAWWSASIEPRGGCLFWSQQPAACRLDRSIVGPSRRPPTPTPSV